jgi:cytochrome c556
MKNRLLTVALLSGVAAACALPAAPAYSQAKPETLVKQRQSAMVLQGKYFGPLALMAQGKVPYDANVVARNAVYLDVLNKMPWDGFHPSTKGEKTRALPAVYTETAKFKEAQDRFQGEVTKLVQVSKGGDEASVKSQITAVQKSCSACHEDFREKQ